MTLSKKEEKRRYDILQCLKEKKLIELDKNQAFLIYVKDIPKIVKMQNICAKECLIKSSRDKM